MKKLNLVVTAACAVFMMQACHNSAKDSAQTADSINATKDTTKSDSSAKMATTKPDDDDAKFAVAAGAGGMTEIAASKLALKTSGNAKIKDFAGMMITDHTDASNKLMALAKTKNITLPTAPDSTQQKDLDNLAKKTGTDFDKAYVDQMVSDHKKTVSLFQDEQKNAKDPDIKAFATNTLPTLQKHLDAITAIKKGM